MFRPAAMMFTDAGPKTSVSAHMGSLRISGAPFLSPSIRCRLFYIFPVNKVYSKYYPLPLSEKVNKPFKVAIDRRLIDRRQSIVVFLKRSARPRLRVCLTDTVMFVSSHL